MAYFGDGDPVFIADGVTIALPTPADRYEFSKKVSKQYVGINNNLIVINIGYRMTLRMIFADMNSADFENIINITDADTLTVRLGADPINREVLVTEVEGEMDGNKDINEVTLEVQQIDLIPGIPNADLYYAIRKIINGACYLAEPESLRPE